MVFPILVTPSREIDEQDDLDEDEVEAVDPEKMEGWKEDLRKLVNEAEKQYGLSPLSAAILFRYLVGIHPNFVIPPE